MAYASVSDVVVSLGRPLTSDEETQSHGLLDRVETRIFRRISTLEEAIADDGLLLDTLIEIEADAVARVLRNPSGLLTEQDGDYMYTRDRRLASGDLSLTNDEWKRLGVSTGAFNITPYLGDLSERDWISSTEWQ